MTSPLQRSTLTTLPIKHRTDAASTAETTKPFARETVDKAHAGYRRLSTQSPELTAAVEIIRNAVETRREVVFPYNGGQGRALPFLGGVDLSLPMGMNDNGDNRLSIFINGPIGSHPGNIGSRPRLSSGEMTAALILAAKAIQQSVRG